MKPNYWRALAAVALLIGTIGTTAIVFAHTPDFTFRAYLGRSLWRPTIRFIFDLGKGLPPERSNYAPYAGMSGAPGDPLQSLRNAYQALFPKDASKPQLDWPPDTIAKLNGMLSQVHPVGTAESDEIDLLRCKILLRGTSAGDRPGLTAVQSCLESYLAHPRPPALTSEARGWLARAYFLQGQRAEAAKIYLDELASASSNIRRQRLLVSLDMLYPDGDDNRSKIQDDLNGYFDTPQHALFIADRITNSSFPDTIKGAALYQDLIRQLEQHKNLFGQGAQSDALALELMRASTKAGAMQSTLTYAAMIPAGSGTRGNPEFDWLCGAANFELGNHAAAETFFNRILVSKAADSRQKVFAANGLVGVYARTGRLVDELHSAFQAESLLSQYWKWPEAPDVERAGVNGLSFDASYLLDIQMTDGQLEEYLHRFPDRRFAQMVRGQPRQRSAVELVRYEQAVRAARNEDYSKAASLYQELHAVPRTRRMEQAEALLAATKDATLSGEAHLQALYDYADFLSQNSTRIFFNDSLWLRFQNWAFVPDPSRARFFPNDEKRFPSDGIDTYRQLERKVRDEQEEYWRAFQIFDRIVAEAGATELSRKAAARAIFCLRRISTERFGHQAEIRAADLRLTRWLAAHG